MTTIRDVAKAAQVSVTTASRVVNKEPTVRSYLRERVEQAIRDLDYRPNMAARQLSSMRSFTIGMIVPRAGVGYIPRLIVELSWIFRAQGHQLIAEAVEFDDRLTAFSKLTQYALRPDAIILAPRFSDDQELLRRFEAEGIPLARLAGSDEFYGLAVNVDDRTPAMDMVGHLIELGHRRIGMIAQPAVNASARHRREGYRQALLKAGLEFDEDLFVEADFTYGAGAMAITRLMALPDRPTAVFVASDTMATGAQAEVLRMGYRVPQDIAIAGFDDSPIVRATYPPITSVSFPVDQMALMVAHAAIHGSLPPQSMVRPLIPRSSTTGDRALCDAPYRF